MYEQEKICTIKETVTTASSIDTVRSSNLKAQLILTEFELIQLKISKFTGERENDTS